MKPYGKYPCIKLYDHQVNHCIKGRGAASGVWTEHSSYCPANDTFLPHPAYDEKYKQVLGKSYAELIEELGLEWDLLPHTRKAMKELEK